MLAEKEIGVFGYYVINDRWNRPFVSFSDNWKTSIFSTAFLVAIIDAYDKMMSDIAQW